MLEDRPYMREPARRFYWSATMVLLAANIGLYLLQYILDNYTSFPLDRYFALSVDGMRHGFVWQLLTFQFMHGGVMHLALNCLTLYMFGQEVETGLGQRDFLLLYFSSGVVGGLFQIGAALIAPGYFGGDVIGASAGIFGVVAAFATLYPEQPLMILLVPGTVRAKYLLVFGGLLAAVGIVLSMISPGTGAVRVADWAHVGGMLMGIFYVRQISRWHWQWPRLGPPRRRAGFPRPLVKVHSQKAPSWKPAEPDHEMSPEEFVSKEVDPILDKISAHGIHSLTEQERKILEAARKRMGKR